jgi:two-component system phosphate regulon sensor histidine kinase PhoR
VGPDHSRLLHLRLGRCVAVAHDRDPRLTLLPRSIAGRIAVAAALTALAALAVVALIAPSAIRDQEIDVVGVRLSGDAALVGDAVAEPLAAADAAAVDAIVRRLAAEAGVRITVIDANGVVLGESERDATTLENHASRPEVATALAGGTGRSLRFSSTIQRDLEYVAVPVRRGGRIVGVARTAVPITAVAELTDRAAGAIGIAALVAAIAAIGLSLALGRAIARPIVRLTDAAARGGPFPPAGPVEVRRLATALDSMSVLAGHEHALAQSERDRLATLIAELGDAILFADSGEIVRLANPAAVRLLNAGPVLGSRLVEVIRDHEIIDAIAQARSGRETVAQVERDDGRRVLRVSVKPLAGGEILLAIQDLSSVRRLETQRQDFVANVSHELRTPLSALKAMVETLRGGAMRDPAAADDFLARIDHEVDGLTDLVGDLLALTRLESGDDALDLVDVDAADLVREAAARLEPLATRAQIRLATATDASGARVRVDPARMAQVLANLVHNAIKFTPAGGTVTLGTTTTQDDVTLFVRDTGSGIDPSDLERIFERFFKSDPSRATGGTGLGLAIAKHAVQAHGGTIGAASGGRGQGATFTVTLPRSA